MRKTLRTAALALATAAALGASAATASSDTAQAGVEIVNAIGIAKATGGDMHFGDVITNGTGGSVVLNPTTGALSETGVALGNKAAAKPATFNVTGDSGAIFDITLPVNGAVTLMKDGDAATAMALSDFTANMAVQDAVLTGGSVELKVGATLTVGADQPVGTYTGSFTVSVAYN